jgi:hypothetical protein
VNTGEATSLVGAVKPPAAAPPLAALAAALRVTAPPRSGDAGAWFWLRQNCPVTRGGAGVAAGGWQRPSRQKGAERVADHHQVVVAGDQLLGAAQVLDVVEHDVRVGVAEQTAERSDGAALPRPRVCR